jgi:Secretion system C-terminal sorting domain
MKTTLLIAFIASFGLSSFAQVDVNGDGELNILIIGTTESISDSSAEFSPFQIRTQLENILTDDASLSLSINVVAEDIFRTETVLTGIAYDWAGTNVDYFCHSLVQYYFWPEDRAARIANLKGENGTDWDYVVIGADPHTILSIPGFYSLGVNKIAYKIAEGGGKPLLLMPWSKDNAEISHFEEFTYRTADGAQVPVDIVPAGLAWNALPSGKIDVAVTHPTPNGAFLAAAAIYSHIFNQSASLSDYNYDDQIADITHTTIVNATSQTHYSGEITFDSPYKSCGITDTALIYNHGGTSTENGILGGLQWVVSEDQKTLQYGNTPYVHFNYGRSSMGTTHLYVIDTSIFDYSFGYPLQDNAITGHTSMQYGIDQRVDESDVETDLGVSLHMVREGELPSARNVPLRTIISQMIEEIPGVDIYPTGDNWHLSADVNKAIATYMYTILTGECALEGLPEPTDSTEWRTWMAHKIGYLTAWNVMYMEGFSPCYGSILSVEKLDFSEEVYLAYPNPTEGNFSIDLNENKASVTITITNMMGQQVYQERIEDTDQINLSLEQPAGFYIVILDFGAEQSVIKLVKD